MLMPKPFSGGFIQREGLHYATHYNIDHDKATNIVSAFTLGLSTCT